MTQSPVVVWFRQDLRLTDNPALYHAAKENAPIIFLYIDDDASYAWSRGSASAWWLHQSLDSLQASLLSKYEANLIVKKGCPEKILESIWEKTKFSAIFWNRCYEPYEIERDTRIKKGLQQKGINVRSDNASLLKEPWEILNQSKTPYKVFTAYWRALQQEPIRDSFSQPKSVKCYDYNDSLAVDDLKLLPSIPWYNGFEALWVPGEATAKKTLSAFIQKYLKGYKAQRDIPSLKATSRLSPHLHWGEISPVQIFHAVKSHQARYPGIDTDALHFLSEIAWREFSYYQLYHYPQLPDKPSKTTFSQFPWKKDKAIFKCWQKGLTGYPIVDAGMRELWTTGWMHNRVRMIVASFLVKNLQIPWQWGEAWFWDTLVDADLANNAASWQWVAGCGADAAPYFRIFNPVLQSKKFDPEGEYITKWCPELTSLPSQYRHEPWLAPKNILENANIILGKTYPHPIIDYRASRASALEAYRQLP